MRYVTVAERCLQPGKQLQSQADPPLPRIHIGDCEGHLGIRRHPRGGNLNETDIAVGGPGLLEELVVLSVLSDCRQSAAAEQECASQSTRAAPAYGAPRQSPKLTFAHRRSPSVTRAGRAAARRCLLPGEGCGGASQPHPNSIEFRQMVNRAG